MIDITQLQLHYVEIKVCELCRLPWDDHVKLAVSQAETEFYEMHSEDDEAVFNLDEQQIPVLPLHCVELLRRERQGPMGPPGPMGPMGNSG